MKLLAAFLLVLSCAGALAAGDEVYRYVDADGLVHYTDRAPERNAKPLAMRPPPGVRAAGKARFYSPEALREAARFAVRVESPTPDERFATGRPPTLVAASVMPGLVKGFRLIYQVDGRNLPATPSDQLSIALTPLSEGSHEVRVILLDPAGREVARSETSRFELGTKTRHQSAPKKN